MNVKKVIDIEEAAKENYTQSEPWPNNDIWHTCTYNILNKYVQKYLDELHLSSSQVILNAGCGKTTYKTPCTIIYMDIIEDYVNMFEKYLIASVEKIPMPDSSVDCIICVGSVINYADVQKAIAEFSRILKPGGTLILEFERSNSAEFLFTKKYAKTVFVQKYQYNNQIHYLWMYSEKFLIQLADYYSFICKRQYRFHILSSLLYRFGVSEKRSAKYSKFDDFLQPCSYFFAHNEIVIFEKNIL